MNFNVVVGYVLGLLIVIAVSGICLKPFKTVIRFVANSLIGIGLVLLINFAGKHFGIHIGINPISAALLGMLGVPGVVMILLAQIFY